MARPRTAMALATAALLLAACGGERNPSVGGAAATGSPLDESAWRIVSDGHGGPPAGGQEAATAAVEPGDLAEQWEAYGAAGSPDDLDDDEVAILIGFGESGSCPEEIHELRVDTDAGEVVVERGLEDDGARACTDDYNPRTIVLGVDAAALPDEPFLLASAGTQRTHWHGVAPAGSPQPPADHPHLGLGYGQEAPVATLEAEPRRVAAGEAVELVVTAEDADAQPAVGDGTSPDPHDELAQQDRAAAQEEHGPAPLVPGTLDRWSSHRWSPTRDDAEPPGHQAVERTPFGELDPGASAPAGRVDTTDLEPGWYRVTIHVVGFDRRGPAEVSAQFQVTEGRA